MAFLEYYAFEEGRHLKETALDNFRALAQMGIRDYILDRVGYDPSAALDDAWRQFHDGVTATAGNGNTMKYPSGTRVIDMAQAEQPARQAGRPVLPPVRRHRPRRSALRLFDLPHPGAQGSGGLWHVPLSRTLPRYMNALTAGDPDARIAVYAAKQTKMQSGAA